MLASDISRRDIAQLQVRPFVTTADNANPKSGDTVTYTITLANNGPLFAESPTASYSPPPASQTCVQH